MIEKFMLSKIVQGSRYLYGHLKKLGWRELWTLPFYMLAFIPIKYISFYRKYLAINQKYHIIEVIFGFQKVILITLKNKIFGIYIW